MSTTSIPIHTEREYCECKLLTGVTTCSRKAKFRFIIGEKVNYSCGIACHMHTLCSDNSEITQQKAKDGRWKNISKVSNKKSDQELNEIIKKQKEIIKNLENRLSNKVPDQYSKIEKNTKDALLHAKANNTTKQLKYQLHPDKHPTQLKWLFEHLFKIVNN